MKSSAGRRPNGGSRKGRRGKNSPWLVICGFGVLGVLWLGIAVLVLPRELGRKDFGMRLGELKKANDGPFVQISMEQIISNMRSFLNDLDAAYANLAKAEPMEIWRRYKQAADRWLLPMDRNSQRRTLFDVRDDKSIFVSLASYRDENCPTTLAEMYSNADRPEFLFVGLVQQNCKSGCKSGVLEGSKVVDVSPDINCFDVFCATKLGIRFCEKGQIRNFFVNEANSLGPAVARYFASKLWYGETFFLQIDAHSLFRPGWDTAFVSDIKSTPSYPLSVLSHYPPDTTVPDYWKHPGYRICGATFASSSVEHEIIRLTAGIPQEKECPDKPCPAPFVGAGFFFAHSNFLADLPFDPYVPWVFMGEEILLSLRFWTWGYDIYSPTRNMLSHMYVRRHTPKFWETVNRLFNNPSTHNDITRMVIQRVKNIAGYPESSNEVLGVTTPSLLAELDLYGDGPVRAMEDYMALVGLDMTTKRAKKIDWCFKCEAPSPV